MASIESSAAVSDSLEGQIPPAQDTDDLTEDSAPLWIHDLTVAYHRKPVLWDVNLAVPEGKLIAVVGPNGAGKTTLIKAALDLVPRASGKVMIYGKSYEKQRHLVGYVPQRHDPCASGSSETSEVFRWLSQLRRAKAERERPRFP